METRVKATFTGVVINHRLTIGGHRITLKKVADGISVYRDESRR